VENRLANQTLRLESKVRKNGFSLIYRWLGTADTIVVKHDRDRAPAVIDLERPHIHHGCNSRHSNTESHQFAATRTLANQQTENNPLTPNPIDQSRHLLNVTGAKINSPRLTPSRVTRRRVPIFLAS
jgi:hypothetical protein